MHKLVTVLIATVATLALPVLVLAWTPPAVAAECAPDANSLSWTVTLSGTEPNYDYDWSFGNGWTTVSGSKGTNALTTPRGGSTLYVRWSSDHGSVGHASANGDLCEQPTPTPPEPTPPTPTPDSSPSCELECSTPTPSPDPTSTPSLTSRPGCATSGNHVCETPKTTLPPTASSDQVQPVDSAPFDATLAGLLFLALLCGILLLPNFKRTRR